VEFKVVKTLLGRQKEAQEADREYKQRQREKEATRALQDSS
jgi:hypothetical protein